MNRIVGPTPEEKREIDRVVARFDEHWEANAKTLQIRRKPRSRLRQAWEFIKPPKHNVFALYWWVKYYWKDRVGLGSAPFPIRHDNTPVAGYPMKYELLGGWNIPEYDLRYLQKGPLALEQDGTVLVPWDSGVVKLKRLCREWGPVFGILSSIATIIGLFI